MSNMHRILVLVCLLLGIQACDIGPHENDHSSDLILSSDSLLQLRPPAVLRANRAIDNTRLGVQVATVYTAGEREYRTVEEAEIVKNDGLPYWQLATSVPSNTDFSLTITWYEWYPSRDNPSELMKLDLVRFTRNIDALDSSGRIAFSHSFSFDDPFSGDPEAADYAGFDDDNDKRWNLKERQDQTDPLDGGDTGGSMNDPLALVALPSTLTIQAVAGSTTTQFLQLRNDNDVAEDYTLVTDADWLMVTPERGTVEPGGLSSLSFMGRCSSGAGSLSATVQVQTRTSSTIPVSLTCTLAPEPEIELLPSSLVMNSLVTGSASTEFVVRNSGNALLEFTIESVPEWLSVVPFESTVAAGESLTLDVGAECPLTAGTLRTELSIRSNAENPVLPVVLNCTPIPKPELSVDTVSLGLSSLLGGSGEANLVFRNKGTARLNYKLSTDEEWLFPSVIEGALEPEAIANVVIRGDCEDLPQTREGSVRIRSDGGGADVIIELRCHGAVLSAVSPTRFEFQASVGETVQKTLTFGNTGNDTMAFSITSDREWLCPDLERTGSCQAAQGTIDGSLAPGMSIEIPIVARCSSDSGQREGKISVHGNFDPPVTLAAVLECRSLQPGMRITPNNVRLSSRVSETALQELTVENNGEATLVFSVDESANWISLTTDAMNVAAGEKVSVELRASCPAEPDTLNTILSFRGNENVAQQDVPIVLVCTRGPRVAEISIPQSLDVIAGEAGSASVSFYNRGDEVMSYELRSETSWLRLINPTGELNPDQRAKVEFEVVCGKEIGSFSGSLIIANNSISESTTVELELICQGAMLAALVPDVLSFSSRVDETDQADIRFSNTGNITMRYTVESDSPWLCPSLAESDACQAESPALSGTLLPGENLRLPQTARCPDEPGAYQGSITLFGNFEGVLIPATLTCTDYPPEPVDLSINYVEVKTFHFEWKESPKALYYQLLESLDDGNEWTVVSPEIAASGEGIAHYDHTVALHLQYRAIYRLRTCNDTGCADSKSVPVSGNLENLVGSIDRPDDTGTATAMDLSGDGSALAVYHSKPHTVTIYRRLAAESLPFRWLATSTIDLGRYANDNPSLYSISLDNDGDTLVVGLPDALSVSCECFSGEVRVYDRIAHVEGDLLVGDSEVELETWQLLARLEKPGRKSLGDDFGHAVAIDGSGSTVFVSSPPRALVHVFSRDSGWQSTQSIQSKAEDFSAYDDYYEKRSGTSMVVSSDGDTLLFNTEMLIEGYVVKDGVTVVRGSEGSWSQQSTLSGSVALNGCCIELDRNDRFGSSMAVSQDGGTIVIGAPGDDHSDLDGGQIDPDTLDSGAVYVYRLSNQPEEAWQEQAVIKRRFPMAGQNFGHAVSLSADGNLLAIAAPQEERYFRGVWREDSVETPEPYGLGVVHIYSRQDGSWARISSVGAIEYSQQFGSDVHLSENVLFVSDTVYIHYF